MRIDWASPRSALAALTAAAALAAGGAAAWAQPAAPTTMPPGMGQPAPWQMDMQSQVTALGQDVMNFHDGLVWLTTAICLFVLFLLVWCIVKFNERANPVPSRTTHNTLVEVAWTVVPVLILVAIAIPSFRILREQLILPKPDLVVKVSGHQWYWSYEYPADQGGGFRFESNLIDDKDLKPGQPRLLAVDNEMVVPVNKVIQVNVTAADVLHNFTVPSFGFKMDAVPGRLNAIWFNPQREGVYYGQCSELCGARHAYMPIAVRVVSEAQYAAWLQDAKTKYARIEGPSRLAAAGPAAR